MNNNYSIDCTSIFVALLQVLFIALKLTNTIDWPWIWVLAPLWITILVIIFIIVVTILIAVLVEKYGEKASRW